MRWHLDPVNNSLISGWVYDESRLESEFLVLAVSENRVVGKATAHTPRPDLEDTSHKKNSGFSLVLEEACDPAGVTVICHDFSRFSDGLVIHAPERDRIGCFLPPYQYFADLAKRTSASCSSAKLQALALPELRKKSVLDLGCNEGFFCQIAAKAGARRVLGLDKSSLCIEKAKARVQANTALSALPLEFRCASWWDAPDEQFDLILFLSAIHYEPQQKTLLDFLSSRLSPDGLLILECGVIDNGSCAWTLIHRGNDFCRFPSRDHLLSTVLHSYAVLQRGSSVAQKGDPIPRYVFHCRKKRPIVVVIQGKSGSGKSYLASRLLQKNVPTYSADGFFATYMTRYRDQAPPTPLYALLAELGPRRLNHIGYKLRKLGAIEEFCRDFVASLPLDAQADLLCIEGEIFRHADVYAALCAELTARGMEIWRMEKQEKQEENP